MNLKINQPYPIQHGVHTVGFTLPYASSWRVPGAQPNGKDRNGEVILRVVGERWEARTLHLVRKKAGKVIFHAIKWKVTIHALGSLELMNKETFTNRYFQVLEEMNAPAWVLNRIIRGEEGKFCRVDIAQDYAASGPLYPTKGELKSYRIKHLKLYTFIPSHYEDKTEEYDAADEDLIPYYGLNEKNLVEDYDKPITIYAQTPTKSVVECRYDKFWQMAEVYGQNIPAWSRVETRYKTGRACKNHKLQTLAQICTRLDKMGTELKKKRKIHKKELSTSPLKRRLHSRWLRKKKKILFETKNSWIKIKRSGHYNVQTPPSPSSLLTSLSSCSSQSARISRRDERIFVCSLPLNRRGRGPPTG